LTISLAADIRSSASLCEFWVQKPLLSGRFWLGDLTNIEQMFRSALDVLDEAVCLCDQTGSVLYANPAERD